MSYVHETEVHNTRAAQEVVPMIINLCKPKSIIDVGCGVGTWLSVFKSFGIKDVTGIDGDYVDRDLLHQHINKEEFFPHDLTQPLLLNKKFDLVISLEVAEHLPESAADTFIQTLTSLGNYVLFAAAIPNQGGQNHINEQWPTYWQSKFQKNGFNVYDCIRTSLWWNENVDWWYKQNMFIAIHKDIDFGAPNTLEIHSIIHPELYSLRIQHMKELEIFVEKAYSGRLPVKDLLRILLESFKYRVSGKKS